MNSHAKPLIIIVGVLLTGLAIFLGGMPVFVGCCIAGFFFGVYHVIYCLCNDLDPEETSVVETYGFLKRWSKYDE